tara:strand:- start:778 stop:1791 length:1014 start_codon:yes stop_codon:yes gene_type:complete
MIFLKILLYPFSIIYFFISELKNLLYNQNIFKTTKFKIPVIGIGNLNTGGSGKTPMAEYIFEHFSENFKLALLSRGYKRSTKGFLLADNNSTPELIGDEPFQVFQKFKKINVAVDEDRVRGVKNLLKIIPELNGIILDDSFQHRKISPKLNILLTSYKKPFFRDKLLPIGTLRESSKGYRRADLVIVTKCPINMEANEMNLLKKQIDFNPAKNVFFTTISYSKTLFGVKNIELNCFKKEKILLVTGVANPNPLLDYLNSQNINFFHLNFSDHHKYSKNDIFKIHKDFKSKTILTTEKDYVKIKKLNLDNNLYFIKMRTLFLNDGDKSFKKIIYERLN